MLDRIEPLSIYVYYITPPFHMAIGISRDRQPFKPEKDFSYTVARTGARDQ